MAALVAGSIVSLRELKIDGAMSATLPESSDKKELDSARMLFPDDETIVVSLPEKDLFSKSSFERLDRLTDTLDRLGGGSSKTGQLWSLISPANVGDVEKKGESLESVPVIDKDKSDPKSVAGRFSSSMLLTNLFISLKRDSWTLYLEPSSGGDTILASLEAVRAEFPGLRFAGPLYYNAVFKRILTVSFLPLIILSSIAILLAELILLRSIGLGILVWISCLVPVILLLGIFSLLGSPIRLQYVLAPVLTLCLATSYTTQLHQGWLMSGRNAGVAVRTRGRMILINAAATMLGFCSLLVSPIAELRLLGLFCLGGSALALLSVFGVLAPALALLPGKTERAEERLDGFEYFIGPPAKVFRRSTLLWALVVALLAAGAQGLKAGMPIKDQFFPGSALRAELDAFESSYGGLESAYITIDTGGENGIVDLDLFKKVAELERDLAVMPGIVSILGYCDLVKEVLGRWEGSSRRAEPLSEADIGESLSLFGGTTAGSMAQTFVNTNWSAGRMRMMLDGNYDSAESMTRLRERVARAASLRGIKAPLLWSGMAVESAASERAFLSGQLVGDALEGIVLALALCMVFGSVARGLLAAVAPAAGFLAALALIAILGWRFSAINSISLAVIVGTGVDIALLLCLRRWSPEARLVAAKTTILQCCSLSPMFLCQSFSIAQATAGCVVGLVCSCLVAIYLLPEPWLNVIY